MSSNQQDNHDNKIERYILGQMTEEEATEFETAYLANQHCLDQLEIAEKFHHGIAKLALIEPAQVALPESLAKDNNIVWWSKRVPIWAVAATFLLLSLPGFLLWQMSVPAGHTADGAVNVINIPMAGVRGVSEENILLNQDTRPLIFGLYVDPDLSSIDYPHYSLKVQNAQTAEVLIMIRDIAPNSDSMLYFSLGENRLTKGSWQYYLYGDNDLSEVAVIAQGIITVY